MASKRAFIRSVDKSSEELYDFTCSPCSQGGRNVEAVNFCEDCMEYFCSGCVQDHNKFVIMRSHELLDKAGMKARKPQQVLSLPTERCKDHHGNLIDTYCGNHDVVCCPTCVSVSHRSCIDITFLPKAAVGIKASDEHRHVKASVQATKVKLENTKRAQQLELERLQREKQATVCEIQQFTKKMIKHLNDLERAKLEELNSKYNIMEDKVKENIDTLTERMKLLKQNANQIEASKGENEAQLFVFVKIGKRNADEGDILLKEITKHKEKNIKFINYDAMNIIDIKSLGELTEEVARVYYTTSHHGDYSMKLNGDKKTCIIRGLCQLDDGTIVVADANNKKLKRLDGRYKVRDHCVLPDAPGDVCIADTNEVVVPVYDEVHFVTIGKSMTLSRSFCVGRKCYGVDYMEDQLFVSCVDEVRVYDKSDKLLRTIKHDKSGQRIITDPRHIAVSTNNTMIHVTDGDGGVVSVGVSDQSHSVFTDPSLVYALAVCVGPDDQLFVSGYTSHNILHIDNDGINYKVLLDKKDGIQYPVSLCYDKVNSRLIVGMHGTDTINMYNLLRK